MGDGGAIGVPGFLQVTNSTFVRNEAMGGGAISVGSALAASTWRTLAIPGINATASNSIFTEGSIKNCCSQGASGGGAINFDARGSGIAAQHE